MKFIGDAAYSEKSEACKLDVYAPERAGFDTVVYFHGGGLAGGDKRGCCYVDQARSFAARGYGFVSVNYRMYPEAKFPDYLEDAARAVAYVKAHVREWGGSGKLLISGQSAGAWIALMLCFNRDLLFAVGMSAEEIGGWLIDSAQTTSHFNVLAKERGLNPLAQRIDEAAPLWYLDEKTAFSRMLLICYTDDMPCRAEQNRLLYRAIREFRPEADVRLAELEGEHCRGSSEKDEDGEYPVVKAAFGWLEEKE